MTNKNKDANATYQQGHRGCCHPKLGSSTIHYVPTTAEFLWEIFLDLEARTLACQTVLSCKRLDGSLPHTPIVLGSKFYQTRKVKSRHADLKTAVMIITSLSEADSDFPRSLSVSTSSPRLGGSLTITATFTVDKLEKEEVDDGCLISISYGVIPRGCLPTVTTYVLFRYMIRVMNESLALDLKDIGEYYKSVGGILPSPSQGE